MKILFTVQLPKDQEIELSKYGYELLIYNEKAPDFTYHQDKFANVDIMVCQNPFKLIDLSVMRNLKMVFLTTSGYEQAPIQFFKTNKIMLISNKGAYDIAVAEWTIMRILELLKNSHLSFIKQAEHRWETDYTVRELSGQTVGILGTGFIGQAIASKLSVFETKLIGFNKTGKASLTFPVVYELNTLPSFVDAIDILIIALSYNSATHHFIDDEMIAKMKRKPLLINVSRGNIINQSSLIHALKSGLIAGAALDVFEVEPLPAESELWDMKNVLISSHNAWVSEPEKGRKMTNIVKNLIKLANGEFTEHKIGLLSTTQTNGGLQ